MICSTVSLITLLVAYKKTDVFEHPCMEVENILVGVLAILLVLFIVILLHFWLLLRKVSDERLGVGGLYRFLFSTCS